MKKKYLSLLPAAVAAIFSLSSCSDSFLDREPEGYYIQESQMQDAVKWNTKVLLGEVQSISTQLFRWKAGGTSSQGDFGQKSIDIATDIMSHDCVFYGQSYYGYFESEAQLINTIETSTSSDWYYYYKVINASNFVFGSIGSDEVMPENNQNKVYYGIAKTVRAYAYYNLLTMFGGTYEHSKNLAFIPVYRTQSETAAAPCTGDSVVRQIIFDCEGAIAAYEAAMNDPDGDVATVTGIDQPDEDVAYTILAYTYLYTGEWAKAQAAAEKALEVASNKSVLAEKDLYNGFNSVDTYSDNWMWGYDITADNTGALCTFWGMVDYYTYSYQYAGDYKVINYDLYNQIPETDGRKSWFPLMSSRYPDLLMPIGKFHSAISSKAGGDRKWESDIHFMRYEEPVLIAAEAAARAGDLASARAHLHTLVNNRDSVKAETIDAMGQQELLDEILYNWRVEFFLEGKSLQTLKRFGATITPADNDGYADALGTGISANDPTFIWAVPRTEKQYNPYMTNVKNK